MDIQVDCSAGTMSWAVALRGPRLRQYWLRILFSGVSLAAELPFECGEGDMQLFGGLPSIAPTPAEDGVNRGLLDSSERSILASVWGEADAALSCRTVGGKSLPPAANAKGQ
jgi:hypothetical protein